MSENTSDWIEEIARAHPKNAKPGATERAICQAIDRLMKKKTEAEAFAYLLQRTKLYAEYIAKWPKERFDFVPEAQNWFQERSYEAREELWEYHGDKGNGKQRASDKNQEALRRAIEGDGGQTNAGNH